eukprot:COSAG02_NODE_881_length_16214_cov_5.907726_9_plen_257_part_00
MLRRLRQHLCPSTVYGTRATCVNSVRTSSSSSADIVGQPSALSVDYVLLVNDDGPPDPEHSPYIETFASHLSCWAPNGRLAVCLPATQQSWRGKAHAPYESLTVTSCSNAQQDWVLVTGTPAAACNYAVHHVGPDRFGQETFPEVRPLVVSGPNFGDNSGRSFMLSSGTLGAALEASLSGHRAVAVSFRRPDWGNLGQSQCDMDRKEAEQVEIASAAVCRLLTKLWHTWPSSGVDLYLLRPCFGMRQLAPRVRSFS